MRKPILMIFGFSSLLVLEMQKSDFSLFPVISSIFQYEERTAWLQRICYSHWANGARNGVISIGQWGHPVRK